MKITASGNSGIMRNIKSTSDSKAAASRREGLYNAAAVTPARIIPSGKYFLIVGWVYKYMSGYGIRFYFCIFERIEAIFVVI